MKYLYLFLVVYICSFNILFGQNHNKLGVCFSDKRIGYNIKRNELVSFIETLNYISETERIRDTINGIFCMNAALYDSLFVNVNCVVSHIEKKTNNFCVQNGKLKKVALFIVDLKCIDSIYANQMYKLLVVIQRKSFVNKLKTGMCYTFLLYQIFGNNDIRQPSYVETIGSGSKVNFLYNGVFIPSLEIKKGYIYVESPHFYYNVPKISHSN